jgi:hypothetical protein
MESTLASGSTDSLMTSLQGQPHHGRSSSMQNPDTTLAPPETVTVQADAVPCGPCSSPLLLPSQQDSHASSSLRAVDLNTYVGVSTP